ncbi:MAG: ATP-binding protein [Pseudomonadota bacterium]
MEKKTETPSSKPLARHILSRRLAYIMLVRVILFTLLLGGVVAVYFAWGTPEELGSPYIRVLFVFIATIYGLNILFAITLRFFSDLSKMAFVQIGIDLLTSAALVHFTGGVNSAFVLFFLLGPIAAAVTLSRRAALATAIVGTIILISVTVLGYVRWLPILNGQIPVPWEATVGILVQNLVIHSGAMFALAVLAGYLAEQLRSVVIRMEVQQARIDDLATLNADIIRCLTSGLLTTNAYGTVLTANEAALEILGVPNSRAVGSRLGDLLPELDKIIPTTTQQRRSELTIDRHGENRVLGVSVSPLTDRENNQTGLIVNFQDLTTLRQMEQAIKRSEHLASLGRLAAGIAHEIRNPLASISGSLELLQSSSQSPDDQKLMDIAVKEIFRLNGLITDFLDYTRPKQPKLTAMDLANEIIPVADTVSELMTGDGAPRVSVVVESSEKLWVNCDREQLCGVLWNLVRNAWQAGEREYVSLHLKTEGDQYVVMEIKDRGSGIPPEDLPHIFEPFFTTKGGGTGLGLATVYRVIQDHNGTIEVTSRPNQGTTFSIILPRISKERTNEQPY